MRRQQPPAVLVAAGRLLLWLLWRPHPLLVHLLLVANQLPAAALALPLVAPRAPPCCSWLLLLLLGATWCRPALQDKGSGTVPEYGGVGGCDLQHGSQAVAVAEGRQDIGSS